MGTKTVQAFVITSSNLTRTKAQRHSEIRDRHNAKSVGSKLRTTTTEWAQAITLAYSVTKRSKNTSDPNSVKRPATNSDSDSAKSNGILFVSARIVMINTDEHRQLNPKCR